MDTDISVFILPSEISVIKLLSVCSAKTSICIQIGIYLHSTWPYQDNHIYL